MTGLKLISMITNISTMLKHSPAPTESSDYEQRLDINETELAKEPTNWHSIAGLIVMDLISVGILIHNRHTQDRWFELAFCLWPVVSCIYIFTIGKKGKWFEVVCIFSTLFQFVMVFAIFIVSLNASASRERKRLHEERLQKCLKYQGSFNIPIDCNDYSSREASLIDMFIASYEERLQKCLRYQGSFNITIDCNDYSSREAGLIDMFIASYNRTH